MSSSPPNDNGSSKKRSESRKREPLSRPTTPLRASSRLSTRELRKPSFNAGSGLDPEVLEPSLSELSDSIADLEANFMHLQIMHESLSRFSENFASFLYGLNMNAFCVDFPEAPILESFPRSQDQEDQTVCPVTLESTCGEMDGEATYLTTDTSFVDNPPTAPRIVQKYSNSNHRMGGVNRDVITPAEKKPTRGNTRGYRGSGLARAKPRGAR
ncbi:DASH complex component Dam1 [Blumeria hordei DH14]|uniref:DASH complex subunit DAM1 n=1 Tax=Blumeria graminis f. sp. hordei (strain DH14) TaxID=546991 RepID=N1J916_BLUG1|nr:DASH complex component Dam1 [Blumeria hordei DH14]